jgi:hypothetical protein
MNVKVWVLTVAMAVSASISHVSVAAEPGVVVEEDPSMLAMTSDLILVRPVMLVATALGSAVWLVSSPFSLAGGNAMQAADTLVVGPAKATFVRCLGCTDDGYDHK